MRWLALVLAFVGLASAWPTEIHPQGKTQPSAADQRGTQQTPLVIKTDTQESAHEARERQIDRADRKNTDASLISQASKLFYATLGLAIITFALVAATFKLVSGTNETARHQLRAYLGVSIKALTDIEVAAETWVHVVNHGKTPGYRTTFKGWYEVGAHQHHCVEALRGDHKHGPKLCDAEGALSSYLEYLIRSPAEQVRDICDTTRSIQGHDPASADTDRRLHICGIVEYDDIFGEHHWTKFCAWYRWEPRVRPDKAGTWVSCGEIGHVGTENDIVVPLDRWQRFLAWFRSRLLRQTE
jgi:hypothetical protein